MCSYTLIIHTAILCRHPLFVTGNGGRSHTLSCHPLLSQSDYQTYQERLGTSHIEYRVNDTVQCNCAYRIAGNFHMVEMFVYFVLKSIIQKL